MTAFLGMQQTYHHKAGNNLTTMRLNFLSLHVKYDCFLNDFTISIIGFVIICLLCTHLCFNFNFVKNWRFFLKTCDLI